VFDGPDAIPEVEDDMPGDRASPLEHKADVVLAASGARILRVTFVGEHHYSHGAEMSSQLKAAVGAERPDGVLVDLLEYEYEFGNDICGLFIAGWHSKSQTASPDLHRRERQDPSFHGEPLLRGQLWAGTVPWLCGNCG
jgi:hypothetical protein